MMQLRLLIPILLLAGCRSEDEAMPDEPVVLSRVETQRPLMGTLFRVITYVEDEVAGHAAMEEALDRAAYLYNAAHFPKEQAEYEESWRARLEAAEEVARSQC